MDQSPPAEASRLAACEGAHAECGTKVGPLKSHACGAVGSHDIEDLAGPGRPHSPRGSGDVKGSPRKKPDLFDPARFAETQKPLLEASTLPGECYNSPEWFEREMDRVFVPSWSLVGREDEMTEPGSYLAIDTEWGGPVAVCRGNDGKLYAFANVCCHRGAKVVQGSMGKGTKMGLVCPYHAWTYNFDGTLKWAPGMEMAENFEEKIRMRPVRVESFHGFVFVCVSDDAPALRETLGDLPQRHAPWFGPEGKAQGMVCVGRREYTVDCNWKFLMENTCEPYHTATVHKGSLGPMKAVPEDPHTGEWDAVKIPTQRSVVPLPTDFEGEQFPLPAFTDRTAFVNLFPSMQINVTWDCLWWMRIFPLGVDRTQIVLGFCFPRETTQLDRFPSVLEKYRARWHIAVSEDNAISQNQQRGNRSRFRRPGRFHPLEFGTHNFNNWVLSKMLDGGPRWDPGQRIIMGDKAWSNDDKLLQKTIEEAEEALKHKVD